MNFVTFLIAQLFITQFNYVMKKSIVQTYFNDYRYGFIRKSGRNHVIRVITFPNKNTILYLKFKHKYPFRLHENAWHNNEVVE